MAKNKGFEKGTLGSTRDSPSTDKQFQYCVQIRHYLCSREKLLYKCLTGTFLYFFYLLSDIKEIVTGFITSHHQSR